MDAHLKQSYLETISHLIEQNARLGAKIEELEKENNELKMKLQMRVYINEMHGTLEGDAYQHGTAMGRNSRSTSMAKVIESRMAGIQVLSS